MGFENEQRQSGFKVDFPEEEEVEYFDAQSVSSHSSLKMETLENPVFYMDKNVMERELPELTVCYEENVYHVVKDICIDDGVPSKGRFWVDDDDDLDEKISNKLVSDEKDVNNEIVKENVDANKTATEDVELLVQNGLKCSIENEEPLEEKHFNHEINLDCVENDDRRKTLTNDPSEGNVSFGYLLSMSDFMDENSNPKSCRNNSHVFDQPLPQGSAMLEKLYYHGEELKSDHGEEGTLDAIALHSEAQKADNTSEPAVLHSPATNPVPEESKNSREEATLPNLTLHIVNQESDTANSDESSCNRNAENGEADPCEATASANSDCHDARISSELDSSNFVSPSNHLGYNHGESSFSAAVPISGLITYSGPIAYSGSLSLRSDSSTTSTRSFAFPVLQAEWNSSPVRMAKAERRRCRNRSWRIGLFCCRF